MKKKVAIKDFVEELVRRIDNHKGIDCCTEEIKTFAKHVSEKIGDDLIEIEWKD